MLKRRIFKLCLFLLLGAIINVAVAWGCALNSPAKFTRYSAFLGDRTSDGFVASLFERSGYNIAGKALGRERRALGACQVSVEPGVRDANTGASLNGVDFQFFGFPTLSMRDEVWWNGGPVCEHAICIQIIHSQDSTDVTTLPLQLDWPGFEINTTFYAAILWLPFAALGGIRRWRRIKRNLCPACAYPIGTSAVCTECGAQLPLLPGWERGTMP